MCLVGEDPNVNTNTTYRFPLTQIVDGTTVAATSGVYKVVTTGIVDGTSIGVTSNLAHVNTSNIVDGTTIGVTTNVAHVNTANILDGTTLGATGSLAHVNTSAIVDGTTLALTGNVAHVATAAILDGTTLSATSNLAHVNASAIADGTTITASGNLLTSNKIFKGGGLDSTGTATQSIADNTSAYVDWTHTDFDIGSVYTDLSADRLLIPATGWYRINAFFSAKLTGGAAGTFGALIQNSGTTIYTFGYYLTALTPVGTLSVMPSASTIFYLTSGTDLKVAVTNTTGASVTITTSGAVTIFPALKMGSFQIEYLGT